MKRENSEFIVDNCSLSRYIKLIKITNRLKRSLDSGLRRFITLTLCPQRLTSSDVLRKISPFISATTIDLPALADITTEGYSSRLVFPLPDTAQIMQWFSALLSTAFPSLKSRGMPESSGFLSFMETEEWELQNRDAVCIPVLDIELALNEPTINRKVEP